MFRIPGIMGETTTAVKPPVFFQHGLFDSSDAFIMNYAEVAPAFVAARAGYDVWLGNTRGNKYSRKNVKWNPDINRE
jgi:pimeloyl-ACP methyl ester carboxylesterase